MSTLQSQLEQLLTVEQFNQLKTICKTATRKRRRDPFQLLYDVCNENARNEDDVRSEKRQKKK